MSVHRITIDTTQAGQTVLDQIRALPNDRDSLSRLGDFIRAIASGNVIAKVRFNGNAVQSSGTITFSSFADADTVTLNGVTLTGKTTPSGASEFAVGSSDTAAANNLVAKVNASALDKIVGCIGASRRATITIASMVSGDQVTINGVVFTCSSTADGSDRRTFQKGSTDAATAENLKRAIGDCATLFGTTLDGITVTRSNAVLTLNYVGSLTISAAVHATIANAIVVFTFLSPGQMGNLGTLAVSAHGTAVSPTGGTEGTEVIYTEAYGLAV